MPEGPGTTGWQPPLQVWLRSRSPAKRRTYLTIMWGIILAGLGPWFAINMFGLQFLPVKAGWIGFLVGVTPGVIAGVLLARLTMPGLPQNVSTGLALIVVLFTPLFLAFISFHCVNLTLPLLHATIIRAPVEMTVQVASMSRSTKACRGSLDISDYAFLHLCDVPSDVRESLSAGDTIVLKGTGSSLGIFYSEMVKAN